MRIVHFELPADDPGRCMSFYQKAFGWTFEKWPGPMDYWMIKTGDGPGIDGGLAPRQHPGQPANNVISVASVEKASAAIVSAGGRVVAPKMPIPGVGWAAYFTDTEGTVFGIIEFDSTAA